jgi:hypothetical protein
MRVMREGSRAVARLAAAVVLASVASAGVAEPASAWRLFSIIGYDVDAFTQDVAALPDGSLLLARDTEVYRRGVSGREIRFAGNEDVSALGDGGPADQARLGFVVRAVSVAHDGAVLIAAGDLIRRVAPDGTISTVAGTADQYGQGFGGYGGDGGPATAARLCGPADVAALPDGGFLIADSGNSIIRRVGPDGAIETVAGVPPLPWTYNAPGCDGPSSPHRDGDGGPATAARLSTPGAVAPLSDGGFLILSHQNSPEAPPAHLRRVDSAGTITTVPGIETPGSVVGMPDGGFAVSAKGGVFQAAPDGSLTPLGGGGKPPSELFNLGDSNDEGSRAGLFNGEGRDARAIEFGGGLAVDPLGGFVLSHGYSVSILAEPPSGRMGIAIRRVKSPARKPRLVYVATAPGTLEMSVRVANRRVGPIRRSTVEAGLGTVSLPRVAPDGYQITVRAVAANGTRDSDRLGIVLGGRLPIWVAANTLAKFECDCGGDAPDTTEYLGRCRRFSRMRVDCRINAREIDTCEYVASAALRPSGFVWTRTYGCPMRRKPRRASAPTAAPLL